MKKYLMSLKMAPLAFVALLSLVVAFAVRPNEAAEPSSLWVGRMAELDGAVLRRAANAGAAHTGPAVELAPLDLAPVDAQAWNPADGHLYLLSLQAALLYEVTPAGELVDSHTIPPAAPALVSGMAFAPSQDSTDAPETQSLYVFGEAGTYEWWAVNAPDATADDLVAEFISSTATSSFDPPSPDPAGITSWAGALVISDSEVDEVSIFAGRTLFVTSRFGVLTGGSDLTNITSEPTGVAQNTNSGNFFYSNDDGDLIYEINRSPDQVVTAGDVAGTYATGNQDPEGIAFDAAAGRMFIIDGAGREVYILSRTNYGSGNSTYFADDATFATTNFDVGGHGAVDPEGIEFDAITGHLFVLDSVVSANGHYSIFEFGTDGTLVNTIDISSAGPTKPAGLTIAPSSDDSARRSFYIVDRGVDNDVNPEENDGRLYELRVNNGGTTPNETETPPTNTPEPPTPTHTSEPAPTNTPEPPTPTAEPPVTESPTGTFEPPTATATATATRPPDPDDDVHFLPVLATLLQDNDGEANNNCGQAHPLRLNDPRGFLPQDRQDWYRFRTSSSGLLIVRLTEFEPRDGQIAVYRGDSCDTAVFLRNVGGVSSTKVADLNVQPLATYFVFVGIDGPLMSEPYRLEIDFTPNN